jgi:hypothetical protein
MVRMRLEGYVEGGLGKASGQNSVDGSANIYCVPMLHLEPGGPDIY